jgi:predicted ester cyclase
MLVFGFLLFPCAKRRMMNKKLGILVLSLLICLVPGCHQASSDANVPDEARSITDQVLKMWNEGDLEIADSLYGPGYVRHHPTPDASASLADLKGTISSNRAVFPDYRLVFDEVIIEGDRLIVFATMTGTNTGPLDTVEATGKRVRMDGVYVFRIAEGKIAEEWTYFNLLHYYFQLGYSLAPPDPSRSDSRR